MQYKGFQIDPVYAPGSDFKVLKDNRVKNRNPKKEDILYYSLYEIETKFFYVNAYTVKEAKEYIDNLLELIKCQK